MSRKMRKYQIESSAGVIYGIFEGRTPREAWEGMVRDGGPGAEGRMESWIVTEVKEDARRERRKTWGAAGVKPRKR